MLLGCYTLEWWGYVLTATQGFPFVVTLALYVGSLRKDGRREFLPLTFGWYLYLWQFIVWAAQTSFNIQRAHPACAEVVSYAFPSIEIFYAGAFFALFVSYGLVYNYHFGWFAWLILFCVFGFAPLGSLLAEINRPLEIAFSLLLGMMASAIFVIMVGVYITPILPYLVHQAPWSWFDCCDSYCQNEAQQHKAEEIWHRIQNAKRAIDARAQLLRRLGSQ